MATATIADQEIKVAVKTVYDANSDLAGVTGPLKEGKLPSPMVSPYARITVDVGPTPAAYSAPVGSSSMIDYRKVLFECWGTHEEMVAAGTALSAEFEWADRDNSPAFVAALPETTRLAVCRPIEQPKLTEDPTVKGGKPVWMLTASYEVMTSRD
jgi:hypothetical protein